jgi:hypothetical protein
MSYAIKGWLLVGDARRPVPRPVVSARVPVEGGDHASAGWSLTAEDGCFSMSVKMPAGRAPADRRMQLEVLDPLLTAVHRQEVAACDGCVTTP